MKKSIRYTGIIAAALLAVAPVLGTTATVSQPTVVKAADTANQPDPDAIQIKLSLKKSKIVFQPHDNAGTIDMEDNLKKIIKTNQGEIFNVEGYKAYAKDKNGKVKWGTPVDITDLKPGTKGIIIPSVTVDNVDKEAKYAYLTSPDDSGELVWENQDASYGICINDIAIKIPFEIAGKTKSSSTKKVNLHGYVKAKKNHKVRTYTSTGKFSKHYVYGHHTYKLNQKKTIKGHGTCYKIYGKSQWIPASKLSLKK